VIGLFGLVLLAIGLPLAGLAHQLTYSGIGAFVIVPPFAIVGFVLARRVPRNPIGWSMLVPAVLALFSTDAGFYAVRAVRLGDDGLPFARVAVFLAAGWFWLILLLPLPIALFPDGRLPRRWRWTLPTYLTLTTIFVAGLAWKDITGIFARHIEVDSSGELAVFSRSLTGWAGYFVETFLPIYAGFSLAWVIRLLRSYRRATGAQREQLKWLFAGGAVCLSALLVGLPMGDNTAGNIAWTGIAALPAGIGIGILKHRLYEIDRLISRTISYLIVTGLLVGVFVGIVALTTHVLPFSSPVGVAASTLAAAALFNPLRGRVQRIVDRRFNRARYDADAVIAAFTLRLRDAVDLDTVRGELLLAVDRAVEPAHASVWIRPPAPRTQI
jgi:hypothetical protein